MGLLAVVVLSLALFAYVFWPQRFVIRSARKTRLEYLRERREVIYDNLRDLNFEYKSGKHPEADFLRQRDSLEDEAATILAETDVLETLHDGRAATEATPVRR